MPKVDLDAVEATNRTGYPAPYSDAVAGRFYRRIGDHAGFADFGASHVVLKPGAASSQRHWHAGEDEMVVMLAGEAVLIENEGRTLMRPGDLAVFPKGVANGHHLINESSEDCIFVAVGKKAASDCHYPDIDMHLDGATESFRRKDGSAYA